MTTTPWRRKSITATGQTLITHGYDNTNRLKQVTKGSRLSPSTTIPQGAAPKVTRPNTVVMEYTDDAPSRLTANPYRKGSVVLGDLTYTYDAAGNRTKVEGSFVARTAHPTLAPPLTAPPKPRRVSTTVP